MNRRSLLALSAAAGLATTRTAVASPQTNALERFIKMRGALDDRLVIGFLGGRYAGVVDGDVIPLFGLFSATFSRYRATPAGFEIKGFEQAYFTDLETDTVLPELKNPYTGETVQVPVTSLPPSTLVVGPDLGFHSADELPKNVRFDMSASGPEAIGDEVFFTERVSASRAIGGSARRSWYNDVTSLRATREDLDRSGARVARCQTSWQGVVSWRPWLRMGDRPGEMVAFAHGGYGVALGDLPRPWLEATARLRPDLLTRPEAGLGLPDGR
jgi:hypothetical protein